MLAHLQNQKNYYLTGQTQSLSFRKTALLAIKKYIIDHEDEINEALALDLGKSTFEAYTTEVGFIVSSIDFALVNLRNWMKKVYVRSPFHQVGASSYIQPEPLGSVLIIGPYNYPFQLIVEPLIGAIAAGNTAIIKPSEFAPHTELVLHTMMKSLFAPEYIEVVTGDQSITQSLIHLPFDHIFFTGSTRVGRLIYEAASKNLVPVTLELGGKSPTIVDHTANIPVAAKRIVFGKFLNAGQTCIAPDYIYVDQRVKSELIVELKKAIDRFYPTDNQYGTIINERHFNRINNLIEHDKVLYSGIQSTRPLHIAPTLVDNVTWQDKVMKEEIFGPILPILTFTDISEVIHTLKGQDKPLALYLFSEDKQTQERVWSELSFGGGAINDTIMHVANPHLPFGGVGTSGIGAYHGKASFDTFSHRKATVKRTTMIDLPLAYPPYSSTREKLIRKLMK